MILIDVRTKGEYETEHIEGAINHDIMKIMEGILPSFGKDEELSLYCESGNRSMMAKRMLQDAGFKNVKDLGSIDNLK
jgi:phage shock protein E